MARYGVTYKEIQLAAEKLLEEGTTPTIEKVRHSLGGKGSNSTISKYLNQWRRNFKPSEDIIPPNSSYSQSLLFSATSNLDSSTILLLLQDIKLEVQEIRKSQALVQEENKMLTEQLSVAKTKLQQAEIEIKALKKSIETVL